MSILADWVSACVLILFRMTCGSEWLRCFRPLPNGAAATPGGCAFRTGRPLQASCTCCGPVSRGATCPPRLWAAPESQLAKVARRDRGRRMAPLARRPADRVAPRRSAGLGRLRGGRVATSGLSKGDTTSLLGPERGFCAGRRAAPSTNGLIMVVCGEPSCPQGWCLADPRHPRWPVPLPVRGVITYMTRAEDAVALALASLALTAPTHANGDAPSTC